MLTPEFDPKPITATKIIDTLKQKTPSEMREFKINTSVQEANPQHFASCSSKTTSKLNQVKEQMQFTYIKGENVLESPDMINYQDRKESNIYQIRQHSG